MVAFVNPTEAGVKMMLKILLIVILAVAALAIFTGFCALASAFTH